jgi:predicted dehydrogenase
MNEQRLHPFAKEFGVPNKYTNYEEMLQKEKPDVLHIVTPPSLRYSLMKVASDAGVRACVVEKPIALQGEDWRDLVGLAERTNTKFCVNTQLNFHPRNLDLKKTVAAGGIGDIKFIDASARSTPVNQGPHVLQLVSSYIDNSRPVTVFGQVAGKDCLKSGERSPDNATATVTYANGVRACVCFGLEGAPMANEFESRYMHKRIAVYGTKGFVHWCMDHWERFTPQGGYETGKHGYGEEDLLGQAGLTEAMFRWLDDDKNVHPTHLKQSLAEFNLLTGIYISAMTHKVVKLPCEVPDSLLDKLNDVLS